MIEALEKRIQVRLGKFGFVELVVQDSLSPYLPREVPRQLPTLTLFFSRE